MKGRLVIIRHGQSVYNQKNLFTGWTDVELSDQGRNEVANAGKILLAHEIYPDICFTSWLKRAIHTAQLVLKEMQWEHIDCIKSWKLNERHYGAWQECKKDEIEAQIGSEAFFDVRRGYNTSPPPLTTDDKRAVQNDPKYRGIDLDMLPLSESLDMTRKRTINYFYQHIVPQLAEGKTVLVSAHGNSIRALVMTIEALNPEQISGVEIPTGTPIVYYFDDGMQFLGKTVLA